MPATDDAGSSDDAGAALPPMALLATLQTAWAVGEGVRERRDGRDPAAQEPEESARAFLQSAAHELIRLHMQLLMANVQASRPANEVSPERETSENEASTSGVSGSGRKQRLAATVRHFDTLMKLRRTDRLLHGAHQRLMSLYPAVSEELVEEARRCRGELSALQRGSYRSATEAGEAFATPLDFFLQRLLSFAAWMEREL